MTYPHSSLLGILLRMCTRNLVQRHSKCPHSCRDLAHIDSWLKHDDESAMQQKLHTNCFETQVNIYGVLETQPMKFSITPYVLKTIMIANFCFAYSAIMKMPFHSVHECTVIGSYGIRCKLCFKVSSWNQAGFHLSDRDLDSVYRRTGWSTVLSRCF